MTQVLSLPSRGKCEKQLLNYDGSMVNGIRLKAKTKKSQYVTFELFKNAVATSKCRVLIAYLDNLLD